MQPVNLSIVVMAHPSRQPWAENLARTLSADAIVWDRQSDVWDTGRRSLLAGTGSHVLVIQDDAVPCSNLLEIVPQVVARWPHAPIALYAGSRAKSRMKKMRKRRPGERYWRNHGPRWGVATVTPTSVIADLVTYCDRLRIPNYDRRMMAYWKHRGVLCVYTAPSLVDHRPVWENPSLVDDARVGNRQSGWFMPTAPSKGW